MNRETRLRKVIPGAPDDLITALAAKPLEEVALIVAALRQARRDAVTHEKQRRRQRRQDARKHRWYDEAELAGRNRRVLDAQGRRAASDLAALGSLDDFIRHASSLRALAVAGLHARGYSDEEIAAALGITRQAVWKLRSRQPGFTGEDRAQVPS